MTPVTDHQFSWASFGYAINRWLTVMTAAVIIILLGLAYWQLFLPRITQQSFLATFSDRKRVEQLNNLNRQRGELQKIVTDWQTISAADRELMGAILPTTMDIPNLLAQVDGLARQSGLVLQSFSVAPPDPKTKDQSGIRVVAVSLTFGPGGYPQLKGLLDNIETNIRLLDLTSFTFDSVAQTLTMNLQAYFAPAAPTQP
ncbi:MAG: type 4a pilus biogenesis protein PilO [Patescibacteria group bacterium]